ncbi:MAG TPA: MarR family transcriptional regulator, partial [Myxococcaceae bacterium]|nr:MarR family transcriptional regulator [Myxococcaceae bacterium]
RMAVMDPSRDLAWLLHRCGQRLRAATDAIATKNGLTGGLRDYVVLLLLETERPKTQSELGRLAGVDKTTLMGVIDRMEREGLVERQLDPDNRRTRTPVLTTKGKRLQKTVTAERLAIEIPGMNEGELRSLSSLLMKLDAACDEAGMTISGSCV